MGSNSDTKRNRDSDSDSYSVVVAVTVTLLTVILKVTVSVTVTVMGRLKTIVMLWGVEIFFFNVRQINQIEFACIVLCKLLLKYFIHV